jgi:hypothetical protein
MPPTIQTWNQIVGGAVADAAASVALSHLRQAPWLANLGAPSICDTSVSRVADWNAALLAFGEGGLNHDGSHKTYNRNGTLYAPLWLLLGRIDADEMLNRRTAAAANHALDALIGYYSAVGDGACRHLDPTVDSFDTEILLGDYVHEYIRMLFIEIYAGDIAELHCTYFRDQLGWFLAGFLPCGWDGAWPAGKMKVF